MTGNRAAGEVELADPRAQEVRARVGTDGVRPSDLHVRHGHWPLPLVLEH